MAWWQENCPSASDDESFGLGVGETSATPCVKCAGRYLDQVFGGTLPNGSGILISKARAEAIISKGGKTAHTIPNRLLNFLVLQNGFDEQHAEHVSGIPTPGIIACGGIKVPRGQALFCFLIDGTHRAVAARRAGRPYDAHVLLFKETFECMVTPKEIVESGGKIVARV